VGRVATARHPLEATTTDEALLLRAATAMRAARFRTIGVAQAQPAHSMNDVVVRRVMTHGVAAPLPAASDVPIRRVRLTIVGRPGPVVGLKAPRETAATRRARAQVDASTTRGPNEPLVPLRPPLVCRKPLVTPGR
jgi:hypothetical protein